MADFLRRGRTLVHVKIGIPAEQYDRLCDLACGQAFALRALRRAAVRRRLPCSGSATLNAAATLTDFVRLRAIAPNPFSPNLFATPDYVELLYIMRSS